MAAPLTALGDRTFGSLRRHRNYRLYFAGSGISFIGTWMQQIASFWLILELTGSPVAVGALALVQTLPVTAARARRRRDRRPRRPAAAWSSRARACMAVQAGLLCFLALSGLIAAWQLYVLGLVQGVAVALNAPARHTLVFQIVGRQDLTNAIALSASLGTTARILGPALGGIVVAAARPGCRLRAECGQLRDRDQRRSSRCASPRGRRATEPLPSILAGVGETLRFAVGSRRVAVVFFTLILVGTFSFNFDVLLPLVARLTLDEGPSTYGLIASVFGAGALTRRADPGHGRARPGAARARGRRSASAASSSCSRSRTASRRPARSSSWPGSSTSSGARARSRPSSSPRPTTCAARAASLYFFGFMGGAPLGGLIAGSLTAQGGTRLAFSVAGTIAILVVAAGAA